MSWVLIAVAAWLVLGASIGLLIGMAIHHADVKAAAEDAPEPAGTDEVSPPLHPVDEGDDADAFPPTRFPGVKYAPGPAFTVPDPSDDMQAARRSHLRAYPEGPDGVAVGDDSGVATPAPRSAGQPARRPSAR